MSTILTKDSIGKTMDGCVTRAITNYGKALDSQFRSACNVALLLGQTLPAYKDGDDNVVESFSLNLEKVYSVRALADKLVKGNIKISKSTVSDYNCAISWIIAHNCFDSYVNGTAKFSIRALRVLWAKDNESAVADYIKNHGIDDLLVMTDSELNDIFKKSDDGQTTSKGKKSTTSKDSGESTTSNESTDDNNDSIEVHEIDGKKYNVSAKLFAEFLAKCSEIADNSELTEE